MLNEIVAEGLSSRFFLKKKTEKKNTFGSIFNFIDFHSSNKISGIKFFSLVIVLPVLQKREMPRDGAEEE